MNITIFYSHMGATLMRIWKGESVIAAKEWFERNTAPEYKFEGAVNSDALTSALKALIGK